MSRPWRKRILEMRAACVRDRQGPLEGFRRAGDLRIEVAVGQNGALDSGDEQVMAPARLAGDRFFDRRLPGANDDIHRRWFLIGRFGFGRLADLGGRLQGRHGELAGIVVATLRGLNRKLTVRRGLERKDRRR